MIVTRKQLAFVRHITMSTVICYTARNIYDMDYIGNLSWQKYIEWSRLKQLTELISLDSMLNELSFQPNFDSSEDWKYIVTDGDYMTDLFNSAEYVLNRTKELKFFNFLAVIKNPTENSKCLVSEDFEFVGYELLDEDYGISALTNCGGFDETFLPDELNRFGLIDDLARAQEIQKDLKANNPEEYHAYCNVFGIWRHKIIGRKKRTK